MNDSIPKGEVIGGKYRIDEVLGMGAVGIVHAAQHLQLDERVALKVLRRDMAADAEAVKRFAREAKAAAKIKSEHVARVFDVGALDDGRPYIVMEYLEGENLAAWLGARGALPVEEAIDFILQACEALVEAHSLGIVHRDLRPSNFFCSRRPDGALSIKLLDFGISKFTRRAPSVDSGPVGEGRAMTGSPFYMSPEQMQAAHEVDHRADIWSLGVILFELLTGTVPFYGGTLPEVCINVATREPRSARAYRPEIPEELENTIARCLEKDPRARFDNLAEFAGSLFPLASRSARISVERIIQVVRKASRNIAPPTLRPANPLSIAASASLRPVGTTVHPPEAPQVRHHLTWVGLGGAAVVVLGVVLLWTKPTANVDTSTSAPPAVAAQGRAMTFERIAPTYVPPETRSHTSGAEGVLKTPDDLDLDIDVGNPEPPPRTLSLAAPVGSASSTLDPIGEPSKQGRSLDRASHATATPKTARGSNATRKEPGADLRREKGATTQTVRDIDEKDPYAP